MWYYDDGSDFSNPADREIIEKRKQLEREERIKHIKEQRRSYLKGQRGKRLYYDRDDYYQEDEEAQIKCIFTRDLRREKFLTCLGEHKLLKPLCLCMMLGGLRTGETLGLMWKDIDFKNKTINVDRAITVVPKFDENGKITKRVTVISETKTACSKRTVPMPDLLVDALK